MVELYTYGNNIYLVERNIWKNKYTEVTTERTYIWWKYMVEYTVEYTVV